MPLSAYSSVMSLLVPDFAATRFVLAVAAVVPAVPPLATASVPDMSAVRDTAPNVGAPTALPCRTVVVVPVLPTTTGAAPAPPPNTKAYWVNAAEVAQVDAELK